MWECTVCGHLNPDEQRACEICGALKGEPMNEDIDNDYLDEEEGLL